MAAKETRKKTTVLFAVTGMSPAILTETVWALAREKPATIPDRVVVLTTQAGKTKLMEELLTPSKQCDGNTVWQTLRETLGNPRGKLAFDEPDIQVVHRRDVKTGNVMPLADIMTPEDNTLLADQILEELRRFTENPDVRIIASIAGGRKTMGALLYAGMTLLGRENDRLNHVLVKPPLDDPRHEPTFYFPRKGDPKKLRDAITLADLPFVPLRTRLKELQTIPGSFRSMVAHYTTSLPGAGGPVPVALHEEGAEVGGIEVRLRSRTQTVLRFLIQLNQKGKPPRQQDAEEKFRTFLKSHDLQWENSLVYPDDLKRELSLLRRQLEQAGSNWMPGRYAASLTLPPFILMTT